MTDRSDSRERDDGELLSAYLADELDAEDAAALERRLTRDPQLAARLDALHDVLIDLRGVERVPAPPQGFEDRLRARVADERAAPERPRAVVTLLPRRGRRVLGSIAAAFVLLTVVGVGAVTVLGDGGPPDTLDVAQEAAGDERAAQLEEFSSDAASRPLGGRAAPTDADGQPPQELSADAADPPAALGGPVIAEHRDGGASDVARATAAALLGTPVSEAGGLAAAYRETIERHAPFTNALHPGECLAEVLARSGEPAVPAAAEAVVRRGADALSYVVVAASPGAGELDTVRSEVVDPETCARLDAAD